MVHLRFVVSLSSGRVQGFERVRFTPDRRICELVFRLEANKPELARAGTTLTVNAVRVAGRTRGFRLEPAGGLDRARGTLLEIPLPGCVRAGRAVSTELDFGLVLGADAPERTGYSPRDRTAYLATAFPLLAWERRYGWMRDPAVDLFGETAGSEDFRLAELAVVADEALQVAGTGARAGTRPGPRPGTAISLFRADAVRDVAVAVGEYDTVERDAGGVRIHVATRRSGARSTPGAWADLAAQAVSRLARLFGPYPYPDLWITVVPQVESGIEFPGAMFLGDVDLVQYGPTLVVHEAAHMWFYGLVGNDQGRDPWLDESFATYAEALVNGEEGAYASEVVPEVVRGQLGRPMRFWLEHRADYGPGVYGQGAQALLRAREAAGTARFDAAIRVYVDRNAHRIVRPPDLGAALRDLPEAVTELRRAGAFVQGEK